MSSGVAFRELSFAYGRGFHLGPLSADIGPGVTCLVGANGAGKSTLFRLLAGLQTPTTGSVQIDGQDAVGYLPQSPDFPTGATCTEFLTHVAWLQSVPRRARRDAVAHALDSVGLTSHAHTKIRALSGGMARRLGIAQALVHDPRVVLLDEPTVGLDPVQRIAAREVLEKIATDRAVVVSTHLVEDVRGLAARILLLSDGQLVFDGDIPALEREARPSAPGETPLEQAMATLIIGGQR